MASAAFCEIRVDGSKLAAALKKATDLILRKRQITTLPEGMTMKPLDQEDRRWKILYIKSRDLLCLLTGQARISNLPADAKMLAMTHDFAQDALAIRLWSASFKETCDGGVAECFFAEVQTMPKYGKSPIADALPAFQRGEEIKRAMLASVSAANVQAMANVAIGMTCLRCGTMTGRRPEQQTGYCAACKAGFVTCQEAAREQVANADAAGPQPDAYDPSKPRGGMF